MRSIASSATPPTPTSCSRSCLQRSSLEARDCHFVTGAAYGTTRMKRACDFLVDRFFVACPLDLRVRNAVRLGAYQLHFMAAAGPRGQWGRRSRLLPKAARGLVNVVLRRVVDAEVYVAGPCAPVLSYPGLDRRAAASGTWARDHPFDVAGAQ